MIKPIAIHLPQFHPFKENDEWWGKGFTEWTNVTKAKPLFKGHYQPHLPADLGFYDLRLEEARLAQEALAKEYGIYGFCYYHYWFNGKRLLHEPIDRKIKNPKEDFPFMLCWANENWTRRWDGHDEEVLIKQNYSEEDDLAHIRFLCDTFFVDDRYIKVEGKPVFVVYRPNLFPDIVKTTEVWRSVAKENGFDDLYLIFVNAHLEDKNPQELGFDAALDFQPQFKSIKRIVPNRIRIQLHSKRVLKTPYWEHTIANYHTLINDSVNSFVVKQNFGKIFPSITPMWDNSARRKTGALILKDSTPEEYASWLKQLRDAFKIYSAEESFFFINAWNEWAEGNHLEPCQKWGKQYLEKTKEILYNG